MVPILITVYDRVDHLKQCINSLRSCKEAESSILYISSDAPKIDEHNQPILEVRKYILAIQGFAKVIPVFHNVNRGLLNCYTMLLEMIFRDYDALIFLEDDIVVAPDFLTYMNKALSYYALNKRVFSVSAFSFSVFYTSNPKDQQKVYFTNRFYPWGFGIWRDRYLSIPRYSLSEVTESLSNLEFVDRLNATGKDLLPAFQSLVVQKKMLVLDYLNTYHMVKNHLVTVVPYQSKSFNIGHDGSGDRTKKAQRYLNVDLSFLMNKNEVQLTNEIDKNIDNRFNQIHFASRINAIKLFLNRLGLLGVAMKIINAYRGKAR